MDTKTPDPIELIQKMLEDFKAEGKEGFSIDEMQARSEILEAMQQGHITRLLLQLRDDGLSIHSAAFLGGLFAFGDHPKTEPPEKEERPGVIKIR